MPHVRLGYWGSRIFAVDYDAAMGTGSRILRLARPVSGWGWLSGGKWYALRVEGTELLFQAGRIKLLLSSVTEAGIDAKGSSAVVRIASGETAVEIEYKSPALKWWNRGDVAYDGLDEELDDFFVKVVRAWEHPSLRASLQKQWNHPGQA